MKRYTENDIADYIINSSNMMFEDGLYYAHVNDNGELVPSKDDATTFTAEFDDSEWANDESPERFYEEAETKSNPDFMRVCEKLADEINEYLDQEVNKYSVYLVGGPNDGILLAQCDSENEAIMFAITYMAEHKDELDHVCGGVMIQDPTENVVEGW